MVFRQIVVTIKNKEILSGVSGDAKPGELLAIMGPSGGFISGASLNSLGL